MNGLLPYILGRYATAVYLPASDFSARCRRLSRRMRGKRVTRTARSPLPAVGWWRCVPPRPVALIEPAAADGNVRLSELGVLAHFAAACEPGTRLFEIGTFDGRTALNLARNAPPGCRVTTLDLPPSASPRFAVEGSEQPYVDKPAPGQRIEAYRTNGAAPSPRDQHQFAHRIEQKLGDSASFDFSPYHDRCALVFVDGSHAYEYVQSDTATARLLVKPGGLIVWHDYGVWRGVTEALDELEAHETLGLTRIIGTSLVCWRRPVEVG